MVRQPGVTRTWILPPRVSTLEESVVAGWRLDEARPGLVFDYDESGRIVGIEVLNASEQVEDPRAVEYALHGHPGSPEVA
jgi:uncharacterized protein YuzE